MAASSLHLPEVVPPRGLEVPFDGIEADPEGPEQAASFLEKEAREPRRTIRNENEGWGSRYRHLILSCVLALMVVAIVFGSVFGTRRAKLVPPFYEDTPYANG